MGARTVLLLAGLLASQHAAQAELGEERALPSSAEILSAAEMAMVTPGARAGIASISSIAACHGPKGDYQTRMVSDRRGNLSFRPFLPDHKNVAGILDGRGWHLGTDGRAEWIDGIETFVFAATNFPSWLWI